MSSVFFRLIRESLLEKVSFEPGLYGDGCEQVADLCFLKDSILRESVPSCSVS